MINVCSLCYGRVHLNNRREFQKSAQESSDETSIGDDNNEIVQNQFG